MLGLYIPEVQLLHDDREVLPFQAEGGGSQLPQGGEILRGT